MAEIDGSIEDGMTGSGAPKDRPRTPQEVADAERHWLQKIYQGDSLPELTLQVFTVSILLGALMIAFNIYMGLKTGWGEGGSLIAVILGYAIIRGLGREYSVLENNLTQTFASAAGSLGNIVNVIPALFLLAADGIIPNSPTFVDIMLWVFFTSFLGVFFAIPLRRQMLVIDQLTFPTGTAAAETIRAMHADGTEAMKKARALGIFGLWAGLITWFRDGIGAFVPYSVNPFSKIGLSHGVSTGSVTLGANISPMMIGVGFLVGPRVAISLGLSGLIGWAFIVPALLDQGILLQIAESMTATDMLGQCRALLEVSPDQLSAAQQSTLGTECKYLNKLHGAHYYELGVKWLMWPGLGLMVAAGLTGTLMKWRILLAAVRSLFNRSKAVVSPIAHLEFPRKWYWTGLILSSVGVLVMLKWRFGVPLWLGIFSIPLSFVLAVIAVRATGETDINPVGAMGSVTQIAFGSLQSASGAALSSGAIVTGNLLTGGVAASGASEAADMMQDLKTGWLLGATPRKQVYAQLMGVFFGSLFCTPIFWVLIQAHPIGGDYWPAPAAVTWSGLATMMAKGVSAIPQGAFTAMIIGAVLGVVLTLLDDRYPAVAKRYLPSAVGMGVALVVPFIYSFSILIGGLIFAGIRYYSPDWTKNYAAAVGAGGIAGEGLVGVFAASLGVVPVSIPIGVLTGLQWVVGAVAVLCVAMALAGRKAGATSLSKQRNWTLGATFAFAAVVSLGFKGILMGSIPLTGLFAALCLGWMTWAWLGVSSDRE